MSWGYSANEENGEEEGKNHLTEAIETDCEIWIAKEVAGVNREIRQMDTDGAGREELEAKVVTLQSLCREQMKLLEAAVARVILDAR